MGNPGLDLFTEMKGKMMPLLSCKHIGRSFLLGIILFGAISHAQTVKTTKDMLVYYTFDEGKGPITDHSGRNLGGTLYGAKYADVGNGYALACDGRKSFAKCGSHRGLGFRQADFSIEFRLKLDDVASGVIMGKKGGTQEAVGWHMEFDKSKMQVFFRVSDGKNQEAIGAPLPDLNWHHVAVVRQGNRITIYMDGKAVATKASEQFLSEFDNDKVFLFLGRVAGSFVAFRGKLDEVILRKRALTAEEVATRYRIQKVNMPPPSKADEAKADEAKTQVKTPLPEATETTAADLLLLHYTFDSDPGKQARDSSSYGHDGEIVGNVEYHEELDGRKGVIRFDGKNSWISVKNTGALTVKGDMSFELWARQYAPIPGPHANIFGEDPVWNWGFFWQWNTTLDIWYRGYTEAYNIETHALPFKRALLDNTWAHIAVVYEFPRMRTYRNGKLMDDLYMPFPIGHNKQRNFAIGGNKADYCTPLDLDEIRFYHRALSPDEVGAHAAGREIPSSVSAELFIEPDWYENHITLRLHVKGVDLRHCKAHFVVNGLDSLTADLQRFGEDGDRFVSVTSLPLSHYVGKKLSVRTETETLNGRNRIAAEKMVLIEKPEWVHSSEGELDEVPEPWTPLKARQTDNGVAVEVWGRKYLLGENALPASIDHQGDQMLAGPIVLQGKADGRAISWQNAMPKVIEADDLAVCTRVAARSGKLNLTVETKTEFDGYIINDIHVSANDDVTIGQLELVIPIANQFAELCYGNRVYKAIPKVAISPWHSGRIDGNLEFKVGPEVWIGNKYKGFTIQMETAEHWRPNDPLKAISIIPRNKVTYFRAHLIEKGVTLKKGEKLYYNFNFMATPARPMLRDGWDLRIIRSEPWGKDLDYFKRTINGKPELQYLADSGVRHLFTNVHHILPFPMPRGNERFAQALHRSIRNIHDAGLKNVPYLLHQRYPVNISDFDVHGLSMMTRPGRAYVLGAFGKPDENGVYTRPGPITVEYGADSQGATMICPRSKAMVDSYMHALGKRYDTFGDDGIYLDGTAAIVPCINREHGCGYYDEQGILQPTFPARHSHEWRKRIYVATKKRGKDNIVDLHCSFGYNTGSVHFADNMWTGEQWHHLRKTGADHLLSVFPLDKFMTEFTGWQVGVASDLLFYRLGKPMRVAAFAFLHDIPGRPSNPGAVQAKSADSGKKFVGFHAQDYFQVMSKIWKMRDAFEIKKAKKYFYFENEDYVEVEGKDCFVTFFHHPENGILAFITNLDKTPHDVTVKFSLHKLRLQDKKLNAFNALTDMPLPMSREGDVSLSLGKEEWAYVWLRPESAMK